MWRPFRHYFSIIYSHLHFDRSFIGWPVTRCGERSNSIHDCNIIYSLQFTSIAVLDFRQIFDEFDAKLSDSNEHLILVLLSFVFRIIEFWFEKHWIHCMKWKKNFATAKSFGRFCHLFCCSFLSQFPNFVDGLQCFATFSMRSGQWRKHERE